jgi:hypothetical protein
MALGRSTKGLNPRIGDGVSMRIWEDQWIPNHFKGKPITTVENPQVQLVDDLLTPSGDWNSELIKQCLIDVDAQAILSTPARVWGAIARPRSWRNMVFYSVWSAYRCLYDDQCQALEENQASSSGDPSWKRCWKLSVPPKVCVFWWRVLNGFLPTKGVLHRCHLEPTVHCEVCGAEEESLKQVLLDCMVAKYFWEEVKFLRGVKVPMLHPIT